MNFIYIMVIAVILDLILGDFLGRWHPVCIIGKLIEALSKAAGFSLSSDEGSDSYYKNKGRTGSVGKEKFLGLVIFLVTVAATITISYLLVSVSVILEVFLLYTALSYKSLVKHLNEVIVPLSLGDTNHARWAVSKIVGRDVEGMSVSEVSRASVETGAESLCDGIVAPLFYAAIGGVPLALAYKAVNTLDSMIAYPFPPYRDIGYFSAKVDDLVNYIPARITVTVMILSGMLLGLDYRRGLDVLKHDASKHPSPNAGQTEAFMAGLLNVRLGGVNYYSGVESVREHMNFRGEAADIQSLYNTINVITSVFWWTVLLMIFLRWLVW